MEGTSSGALVRLWRRRGQEGGAFYGKRINKKLWIVIALGCGG